jgi:spermidine synthase
MMLKYWQAANVSDAVERKIAEVIAQGRTPFQEYLFFRSEVHGMCIALDGDIQSCESDEAIYHEALVQPAMLLHPDPRRVLIMGGGEGSTAREVLKHQNARRVVMVDIDREFVELCRRHIPHWAAGALEDSRLTVNYQDINKYLGDGGEPFDVVIGDLIDVPDPASPAAQLYGEPFYTRLKASLSAGAILATQAGPLAPGRLDNHKRVSQTLGRVFKHVASYAIVVPSFYHLWSYVVASDNPFPDSSRIAQLFKQGISTRQLALPAIGGEALAATFVLVRSIADELRRKEH